MELKAQHRVKAGHGLGPTVTKNTSALWFGFQHLLPIRDQGSGKDNSMLWLPKDRAPDETDALLSGDKLSHFPSSMAPVQKASHVHSPNSGKPGLRYLGPMDVIVGEVTV